MEKLSFKGLVLIAAFVTLWLYLVIPLNFNDNRVFSLLLTDYDLRAVPLFLLGLLLCLRFFEAWRWVDGLAVWLAENPIKLVLLTISLLGLGSLLTYRAWPLTMDEYAPWFQAHLFANGELVGHYPLPVLAHLFDGAYHQNFFNINWQSGDVISAYWPGLAFLMMPFAWLGVPWLCNPMITGLTLIALQKLAARLGFTQVQQGWVLLFSLASPAFTINGMAFYSMPAHLLFNTLFVYFVLSERPRDLFLAGLAGGLALTLHNPFPHAVFSLPWLAWVALRQDRKLLRLSWLAAGYLPFAVLLGAGWIWVMKSVAKPVVQAVAPETGPLVEASLNQPELLAQIFAAMVSFLDVFHWPDWLILSHRLGGFIKLWLWAVPVLLPLAMVGFSRTRSEPLKVLGYSAITSFAAYFLIVYDQGHGWGYRYFHPAWMALPILGVAAMQSLDDKEFASTRLMVLALFSLLVMTPLRVYQVDDFLDRHFTQLPVAAQPLSANECEIVFHGGRGFFGIDMVENKPALDACKLVLYGRNRDADMAFAQSIAPGGREVYRNQYGWVYRYPKSAKPVHLLRG